MKRSQILHFTGVKFFALKYGCVNFLTNIMSVKILTELKPYPFVGTDFVVVDDAEELKYLHPFETQKYQGLNLRI